MTTRQSVPAEAGKKVKAVIKELLAQIPPIATGGSSSADPDGLRGQIADRAYRFYEERGFRQGCDLQDWLDAEREILSRQRPL